MKQKLFTPTILLITIWLLVPHYLIANSPENIDLDSVIIISDFKNLYKSGDYYFGGQPSLEMLRWLRSENVTTIINLRSEKEMNQFNKNAFNEEKIAHEMNFKYYKLSIAGENDYTPEKLKVFAEIMDKSPEKVFIHCGSCVRVTYLIMAYLYEYKHYPMVDIIEFGKQIKYNTPLENLLGKKITYSIISN